jgi:hypothetical protein
LNAEIAELMLYVAAGFSRPAGVRLQADATRETLRFFAISAF